MKVSLAEQYSVPCVHLDGTEDIDADGIVNACRNAEATYDDGEDVCFVVAFPGRPQELYTEEALRGSMQSEYWRTSNNPTASEAVK